MKKIITILTILVMLLFSKVEAQTTSNFFMKKTLFGVNYVMGFPMGDFHDFMPGNSFRGFDLELKTFVSHNIMVGGSLGYSSYYHKFPRSTYEFDGGALTSTVFHYFYTLPMHVVADYYFVPEGFIQPFIGLETGVNYNERRTEVGYYYLTDKTWNFILTPEAGVIVPLGKFSDWGLLVRARYNYQVYSRDNFKNLSYLDLSIGFSYSY